MRLDRFRCLWCSRPWLQTPQVESRRCPFCGSALTVTIKGIR